ncbi:NADPH-dependent pterin aldehyde reductase-like isoform X2 [Momordica charantia]|uniref:NADPH-dependent pterin aldehyde reductase-like isoform X2 n=1 Tax=Momordica charantia TaxID=3673 RepID=A0A6J1DPU9_MOMCH|nr:NADPH-dependent pterin aldehyde reductase-like isoform X2 [Momordica charantia]
MATPIETSRRGAAASRKVLITGVSKGLGRALALELASRGHTIIGCSRDQTKLDSLHAELSKSSSNEHLLFNADVRSNNKVKEFAHAVEEKKLTPDIIVNNAGLAHKSGKIWELDVEDFDKVIDTNVKGIGNILRHFIPLMLPNNQGIIVNMSSGAGRNAHEDFAPYCTSKWAVEGLSKCIAKGLPEGMATVALNPGTIYTDMLALCMGELASQFQSPDKWAARAATMILDLTTTDNGASLTVENLE